MSPDLITRLINKNVLHVSFFPPSLLLKRTHLLFLFVAGLSLSIRLTLLRDAEQSHWSPSVATSCSMAPPFRENESRPNRRKLGYCTYSTLALEVKERFRPLLCSLRKETQQQLQGPNVKRKQKGVGEWINRKLKWDTRHRQQRTFTDGIRQEPHFAGWCVGDGFLSFFLFLVPPSRHVSIVDEWTWKRLASQRDSPGDISGERWKNSRVMDVSWLDGRKRGRKGAWAGRKRRWMAGSSNSLQPLSRLVSLAVPS